MTRVSLASSLAAGMIALGGMTVGTATRHNNTQVEQGHTTATAALAMVVRRRMITTTDMALLQCTAAALVGPCKARMCVGEGRVQAGGLGPMDTDTALPRPRRTPEQARTAGTATVAAALLRTTAEVGHHRQHRTQLRLTAAVTWAATPNQATITCCHLTAGRGLEQVLQGAQGAMVQRTLVVVVVVLTRMTMTTQRHELGRSSWQRAWRTWSKCVCVCAWVGGWGVV